MDGQATGSPERVAIVGGGAAGCITALELLARDPENRLRIDVFEMAREAHTTLCGEGISESSLALLSFDSRPHVAHTFRGAAWRFPGPRGPVTVNVDQPCHTIERCTWIPSMAEDLERKDVRFHYGEKMTAARIRGLPHDLVVGAEGPGSRTRELVPGASVRMRLGLQYRVGDSDWTSDRLLFVTDKAYSPEYAWVFPKRDILNVGTLGYEDGGDWDRIDRFMAELGVRGRIVKREAYPIAFGGTRVQAGRYVLIGDAAGLTNPVTKGGLAAIIYAARILADCWAQGRVEEYGPRVFRHPITDPSFTKALAMVERSSNRDIARILRYAPDVVTVGDGSNGGTSGPEGPRVGLRGPRLRLLLRTMARMPHKAPALWTLYRALGLSRRYSW